MQNYPQYSENREAMATLWCSSLCNLLEAQARPVIVEEAKAYQAHGQKNAKNRPWWELRCMIRSLSLFCANEQLAEIMVSSGLLQVLKALTYHKEDSLCVQICRILSDLSFQHNSVGVVTCAVSEG